MKEIQKSLLPFTFFDPTFILLLFTHVLLLFDVRICSSGGVVDVGHSNPYFGCFKILSLFPIIFIFHYCFGSIILFHIIVLEYYLIF